MKALILAGGLGTRLREVISDRPKPMALIAGKPFLEHQINFLNDQGVRQIILAIGYKADVIKSYFGNGGRFGIDITYSEEDIPLGTAGAIKNAEKYIDDTFYALNGDTFSHIDLQDFLDFHEKNKGKFSVGLARQKDGSNYGKVVLTKNKIKKFTEKGKKGNFINRGIYIFDPTLFEHIEKGRKTSLEEEVFPELIKEGKLLGYFSGGYFMDIGRPETYGQFKKDFLKRLFLTEDDSVKIAMQKIYENRTDLMLVVNKNKKLIGVVTDRGIKRFLCGGIGGLESKVKEVMFRQPKVVAKTTDEIEEIQRKLLGVNILPILDKQRIIKNVVFKEDEIKSEKFPIIRGKSPLRISFAGGGTDIPYYFDNYGGGIVINATIDKHCHGTAIRRADDRIIINPHLGTEMIFERGNLPYNNKFDLIKAVINTMKPNFGFELDLYNDVPPGRGLGSSASFSTLIASLLSSLENAGYDDSKIAEIAYSAETNELGIKGGWQDQYAAVTGGFNFIEFAKERNIITPLRLKEDLIYELKEHISLCYIGGEHFSGNIHKEIKKSFDRDESKSIQNLNRLKQMAVEIKNSLLVGELEKIGHLLHESWLSKKELSTEISNPKIDNLYEIGRKNGAQGGKLLGAGGAGYILFFHPPKKRNNLVHAIENAGGEFLDFNFDPEGTKTWNVRTS